MFYRRDLGGATNTLGVVVYAIFPSAPSPSDAVSAAIGAFPRGYRPTDEPGQVIADPATPFQFWTCDVLRSALRRYEPLLEREAYALYPRLEYFVARALESLTDSGDLPAGR